MIVNTYYTGPLGTNTYLAYDETKKAFIVDPSGYSDALVNDVNGKGLTAEYILLTHGHVDYIGGVSYFMETWLMIKIVANTFCTLHKVHPSSTVYHPARVFRYR